MAKSIRGSRGQRGEQGIRGVHGVQGEQGIPGSNYIDAQTFCDFKENQAQLIQTLNHSMTKLSVDVSWLKKINGWQLGVISALTVGMIVKMFI